MIGCTCGSLLNLAHKPPCPWAAILWKTTDQKGIDHEGVKNTKPVNCPECGRFEGHVVTCSAWRPKRPDQRSEQIAAISGMPRCIDQRSIDDAGLLGAWEGVATSSGAQVADSSAWTGRRESGMTPPNTGYQPLPRGAQCWCDYGWFDRAGGFWCCGGAPGMPKYREHPFYERSKAAVIARGLYGGSSKPMTNGQENKMADRNQLLHDIAVWIKGGDGRYSNLLLKSAHAQITADGEIIKTVESLAAENRCLRDGALTDANRMAVQLDANERLINKLAAAQGRLAALKLDPNRDGEEAAPKTGLASGGAKMPKTSWAVQPQIDDLDARICAIQKVAHAPYDFTALVERFSRFERRINDQGRRLDCLAAGYGDGTTSIKPPPATETANAHATAEREVAIAAAARKDTMRELAVQMRTIIGKCVSGTTLDNTDCVLLTTILDDYFGDKAGDQP